MKKPSPCPKCKQRPRRAPGLNCNTCEAEWKRNARAKNGVARAKAEKMPRFTRALEAKRYLITSAQNATPIEPKFFAALEVAAKHLCAELVVIPFRYKNPTSVWTKRQDESEWWAPELRPYLHNTRKKLNANLVLAADVKMQPTASDPVSGFEALTGGESCILGHPKLQMKVVPAPSGRMPKIVTTTGACTKRNYTDTKQGKLGAFHHFLGAILVEVEGKTFHLRQLNADRETGAFIDLDKEYTPEGVQPAPPAAGLVTGDTHARISDPDVDRVTFGSGGIVETLKPREVVFHDLFDGISVNPHHAGDPFIAAAKSRAHLGDPKAEIEHAVKFVSERATRLGFSALIAPSNHDDFLSRWMRTTDWRFCGARAFYLQTALIMERNARATPHGFEYPDPFVYWVNKLKGRAPVRCLARNSSHKIAGVEIAYHGHVGPNGAKSTMKNMARVGSRMITGHAHTPGIEEGHYRVGTSTPLRLDYTNGPSSWLNCHAVIYANGKRALLVVVGGKWRLGQ